MQACLHREEKGTKGHFLGVFCVTEPGDLLRGDYNKRSKIITPNKEMWNTSKIHEHLHFFD